VLRESRVEDARTTIEWRRETRRRSDERNGPIDDEPAPGVDRFLPFTVDYPAFTKEL
jgi:hypothetical protein